MLELKSCPHCNGNGRIVSVSGFKSDRYRVVCEECGASTRECETEQEAVSAWNMRAYGWIPVGERLPESCAQYKHKDDERVVRCRDCQWYGHKRACPLAASGLSADCVKLPKEDDFCSYGERRKENG